MIWNADNAKSVAEHLLQINAIKLQPAQPFTWASGWKSPIYCDNRLSLSFPEVRNHIVDSLVSAVKECYGDPDYIAGVATGAIAVGALVADRMNKPMVYVRSSAKGHGRQNKVEGNIDPGKSVVVIEDLVSTGMSSLDAVSSLREIDVHVLGMAAIFTYGFDVAEKNFAESPCRLVTLSNYDSLIEAALGKGFIEADTVEFLKEWRKDPSKWGK